MSIPLRNKHLFGLVNSAAFRDYTWQRLHDEELIEPILNSIKQAVKDEKIDKPIEYVVLTVEENNDPGNEEGNTYALFFYARLDLGKTKSGEPARIKKMLSLETKSYSPAGLPFGIQVEFTPNPYDKKPNPFRTHYEIIQQNNLPASKWEHFEVDHHWVRCDTIEADCMDEILSCSTQEEAKEFLIGKLDPEELPTTGVKKMKAYKEFQRQNSGPAPFTPAPFCEWGLKKLAELEPHVQAKNMQLDRKCKECREYRVWDILKHWYDDIFVKQKVKGKIKLNDGTIVEEFMRKRFIIVKGDRRTGKTQWFKNLTNRKAQHIGWIKHKLSRENTASISSDCWLVVLDDFAWAKHDRDMMKAITSAEYTELDGKWLSKSLPPGIPCVVLFNDSDDTLYKALKKDRDFMKEAIFVNLKDICLAPDDVDNNELEYHGPKSTLDSDEEDGAAGSVNAIAVIMQQDGKPTHTTMEEYEVLRKKFEDTVKENKNLKLAYNNAQKQVKGLQRGLLRKRGQTFFKIRDDEEDLIMNPKKQRKVEASDIDSTGNGSDPFISVAKPAQSCGQKSGTSRAVREYDVPAFPQG
jgi:hypothetical protein